jgi:hypothetical protein
VQQIIIGLLGTRWSTELRVAAFVTMSVMLSKFVHCDEFLYCHNEHAQEPKQGEGRHHGRYVGPEHQENACRFWVGPPRPGALGRFTFFGRLHNVAFEVSEVRGDFGFRMTEIYISHFVCDAPLRVCSLRVQERGKSIRMRFKQNQRGFARVSRGMLL